MLNLVSDFVVKKIEMVEDINVLDVDVNLGVGLNVGIGGVGVKFIAARIVSAAGC